MEKDFDEYHRKHTFNESIVQGFEVSFQTRIFYTVLSLQIEVHVVKIPNLFKHKIFNLL